MLAVALVALTLWTLFVVASCSAFAMGQWLQDRCTAKTGDFLVEGK